MLYITYYIYTDFLWGVYIYRYTPCRYASGHSMVMTVAIMVLVMMLTACLTGHVMSEIEVRWRWMLSIPGNAWSCES